MSVARATVPILRGLDEAQTRDLDLRRPGFVATFGHRSGPGTPPCMGVRLDGAGPRPSEHHGDAAPGSAVRIEMEVAVKDPSGNRLVSCPPA